MKVAIAVPSGDEVKSDFWLCCTWLCIYLAAEGISPSILNARTSLIENSRYLIVKDALQRGCDKIMFIDSDMTFPPDSVTRLLAHEQAIVGATYVRRRAPHGVLGHGLGDIPPGSTGVWPFARLPGGFMLVDADVFRRLPAPWFLAQFDPKTQEFMSEDYSFCDAARAAGYSIWCDLDLSRELGHIGTETFVWGLEEASPDHV